MDIFFGVILLVAAVFLVIAVLMQSGKSKNLLGAIAGGAETFFGKTKGKAIDKVLSKVTTVVSVVFVVIVLIVYILQPDTNSSQWFNNNADLTAGDTAATDTAETTAAADGEDVPAEDTETAAETTAAE
ncbi:MAG: preprotein translocase subunit SecG [Eubacteriales bacterium]